MKLEKQREEKRAWINIFDSLESVFNVTREELNQEKFRPLFVSIEKWAYADRMLRSVQKNPEEFKGCLWRGGDEE